jgi:hypothetical protein
MDTMLHLLAVGSVPHARLDAERREFQVERKDPSLIHSLRMTRGIVVGRTAKVAS